MLVDRAWPDFGQFLQLIELFLELLCAARPSLLAASGVQF